MIPESRYPIITKSNNGRISRWVTLVTKEVQFSANARPRKFHCVHQNDYVGVLALTPDRRIPIVRQYRPAVEAFTWEFPAGCIERGESPLEAAARELREEAGMKLQSATYLGEYYPDSGRLQLRSHAFFARATLIGSAKPENGLELRLVTHRQLRRMILRLEFKMQVHLAIYAAAVIRNIPLAGIMRNSSHFR
jgi:ADP-ribose pyrophosphatase